MLDIIDYWRRSHSSWITDVSHCLVGIVRHCYRHRLTTPFQEHNQQHNEHNEDNSSDDSAHNGSYVSVADGTAGPIGVVGGHDTGVVGGTIPVPIEAPLATAGLYAIAH